MKQLATDSTLNINWQGAGGFTALNYACSEGRLSVVQFLLTLSMIDVNKPSNFGFTPFLVACFNGSKEMVSLFLADKRTDVNIPMNTEATPFFMACQNGHKEVVSLLLADMRVDVNKPTNEGCTPFNMACQNGHKEVVSLLLADSRIDVKKPNRNQASPLFVASQKGRLSVVQLLLASGREVDTKLKTTVSPEAWSYKTAAEMARFQGSRAKEAGESDEDYLKSKQNGPIIAALLDSFNLDPATTSQRLRELPEFRDSFISDLFALVVFLCDDFLTPCAASSSITFHKAARFFQIAQSLPIELQMVLCNRAFGVGKDIVLTKLSEPAFKRLGRLLTRSD